MGIAPALLLDIEAGAPLTVRSDCRVGSSLPPRSNIAFARATAISSSS